MHSRVLPTPHGPLDAYQFVSSRLHDGYGITVIWGNEYEHPVLIVPEGFIPDHPATRLRLGKLNYSLSAQSATELYKAHPMLRDAANERYVNFANWVDPTEMAASFYLSLEYDRLVLQEEALGEDIDDEHDLRREQGAVLGAIDLLGERVAEAVALVKDPRRSAELFALMPSTPRFLEQRCFRELLGGFFR